MPEPAQSHEPPPGQAAEDAQYYRRVLHRLIDMGTEIATEIHQQATATPTPEPGTPEPGTPKPDHTIPFERIARSIRRTILLAQKVAQPVAPKVTQPQSDAGPDRTAARKRILREVEDAIQRETEGAVAKSLDNELLERLESPDLDEELATRPVPEIIANICRDLGIAHIYGTHPWKRRTPEDIETLRARAATPPQSFLPGRQEQATAPP